MKPTVSRLFKITFTIFAVSVGVSILLGLAQSHLPPNRMTHECKLPPVSTKQLRNPEEAIDYEQAFCQEYYYAEFKESWERAINNVVVPAGLLAGLALVPISMVLLFRWLSPKKH